MNEDIKKHYFLASVFIVIVKPNGVNNTLNDGMVFSIPEYKITDKNIDYIKNFFIDTIKEKFGNGISNVAVNVTSFSYMGYMTDDEYYS